MRDDGLWGCLMFLLGVLLLLWWLLSFACLGVSGRLLQETGEDYFGRWEDCHRKKESTTLGDLEDFLGR